MGQASNKKRNAGTVTTATAPITTPKVATPQAPGGLPPRVPPLFRRIDWLTFGIAFAVVWTVYFLTLAPELTLEDSGELCTGSFYAGIPHPPGYPFWAIYSWLWTKILPFGNVAWRVEVGEASAAALACGMVAFMVSRGSSMLMEGIEDLKGITGKWENAICVVSGLVAGLVLGFGGVMWSESVAINRISLFGVPWVTIVLLCLMRWIYAPHQRRYLYIGLFCFGICATIHQTLLVAAMGIEVAIAAAQPRLGRTLFLGNSILFALGLILNSSHFITLLDTAGTVQALYWAVGILSIAAYVWFCFLTKSTFQELSRDGALVASFIFLGMLPNPAALGKTACLLLAIGCAGAFIWMAIETWKVDHEWVTALLLGLLWFGGASFYFYEAIAGMTDPPMQWGYPRTVEGFFHALSRGQYEKANFSNVLGDPLHFLMQLGMMIGDVAGEFNWVLMFVALVPLLFFFKMKKREQAWLLGLTAVYFCIGVLLVVLMNPSPDRQSADLIKVFFTSSHAVIAVMVGYGLALIAAYMATHYHLFRPMGLMLCAVILVPALLALYNGVSHTFYGDVGALEPKTIFPLALCLVAALVLAALAGHAYIKKRSQAEAALAGTQESWNLPVFAGLAAVFTVLSFVLAFFHPKSLSIGQIWTALPRIFAPHQYCLPVLAGVLILGTAVVFTAGLLIYKQRAPLVITLGLFCVMPLASALSHWAGSEQRGHWFGYWFGHDMFTPPFNGSDGKPLYPEMAKDTILYGGTDPGRFCPTYMIFCESFIPHDCQPKLDQKFDRRDVYLITQNALADGTYLNYLRAQYYRSQQIDPPFFSELARTLLHDKDYETNLLARLATPLDTYFEARGARIEKRWRTYTSWFGDQDITDFNSLAARLRPGEKQDAVSKWLFDHFSKATQDLLTQKSDDNRLKAALREDLNRLLEQELKVRQELADKQREKDTVEQQIADGNNSARLAQQKQELPQEIAKLKVEPLYDANRFAGVEISDYLKKFIAQNPQSDTRIRLNRLLLEAAYPTQIAKSLGGVYPDREIYIADTEDSRKCFTEYLADAARRRQMNPPQLKPGEDVNVDPNGQVQVSGQVAVMSINGLLTKVIFDHNPDNEFYVEESMPLDWMYPHLTPFGIIMHINRKPVPELTDDIVRRDHEFWSQYSARLCGNWITYDTSVSNIVAFVEKTYLRHDFTGFVGDHRFVRDEQAQKAFSKLRSSIAGVYLWRLGMMGGYPTAREYLPKSEAERQRMVKEADFAFRQAFAFCPYSPEAVFRYVSFLTSPGIGRYDDALLVAETCRKLDPENGQVVGMVESLEQFTKGPNGLAQARTRAARLEREFSENPNDVNKAFELAQMFLQLQESDRAIKVMDSVVANPSAPANALIGAAQFFESLNLEEKVGGALTRLTQVAPNEPEVWYNLATHKVKIGNSAGAIADLQRALDLNVARLKANSGAVDIRTNLETDPRFAQLRNTPEYKTLRK